MGRQRDYFYDFSCEHFHWYPCNPFLIMFLSLSSRVNSLIGIDATHFTYRRRFAQETKVFIFSIFWFSDRSLGSQLSCRILGGFGFRSFQLCETDPRHDKFRFRTKQFPIYLSIIVSYPLVYYSECRLTTPLCVSLFWSTRCTLTMWYVKSISSYLLCWPSKYTMVQPAQFKPSPNSCLKRCNFGHITRALKALQMSKMNNILRVHVVRERYKMMPTLKPKTRNAILLNGELVLTHRWNTENKLQSTP